MCGEENGMKKPQKGDMPAESGNVTTIDLGEKIDQVIRDEATKLAGRPEARGVSRFAGGYRPGMYGGYRPWYASRLQGQGDWKLGTLMRLPDGIREKSKDLFAGGMIGTVGNRVIAWVAPDVLKTTNQLAVEGVAFGVTLLPYVFKQNVTTFGIALPGFFFFLGALTESLIGATKLLGPKTVLSGRPAPQAQGAHADAVMAARRKLAEAQARMQQQRQMAGSRPAAVARPRVAV